MPIKEKRCLHTVRLSGRVGPFGLRGIVHRPERKISKILFMFGDLASFTNLAMASIVTSGFEKALLNLRTVRSSAGESFFCITEQFG